MNILVYRVTVWNEDVPNGAPFLVANVTENYLDMDILSCSTYLMTVASVNVFLEPGETNSLLFSTNCESGPSLISITW